MPRASNCKFCNIEIIWILNSDGKWIATSAEDYDRFDYEYDEPKWHSCAPRQNSSYDSNAQKECYNCGQLIYFDPKHKSVSGKFIPMQVDTEQPHNCPKSQKFRKQQDRDFAEDQELNDRRWWPKRADVLK